MLQLISNNATSVSHLMSYRQVTSFFFNPVLVFKVLRLSLRHRGRQHLAMPLKTCHNIEAGFLTGWLLCYPPTQRWRHLRLRRSCTWAVCLPLSPQKGDHPPSHDDNFARTSVCRWLPQKPTASQVEAARNPEKGGLYSDLPTPSWTCLSQSKYLPHLPSLAETVLHCVPKKWDSHIISCKSIAMKFI